MEVLGQVLALSLAVDMTVMVSAICSWIGWRMTTIVCSSSRSGVTSGVGSGSVSGFLWSSLMAPRAAAGSRAVASKGSQSYNSRVWQVWRPMTIRCWPSRQLRMG